MHRVMPVVPVVPVVEDFGVVVPEAQEILRPHRHRKEITAVQARLQARSMVQAVAAARVQ
jgi:hypothetical protein